MDPSPPTPARPLEGLRLHVRSRRHDAAICAELLTALGAVEASEQTADIVLTEPGSAHTLDAQAIRCDFSVAGGDPSLPGTASELLIQAWSGMMAATGEANGPPRIVRVPLLETFAGVDGMISALAALRLVEAGGTAQRVDTAVADAAVGLLGTFISLVLDGKRSGFRDGCRHPICVPWNAYRTRDGRVMLCSASELQWHRLAALIGVPEAKDDARFADMAARARHVAEVDALVEGWTKSRDTQEVVAMLLEAGLPAGPIRTLDDMISGPGEALIETRHGRRACMSPLRLVPAEGRGEPVRRAAGSLPLAGVRVLEIGPFTAGPLAGRLLADLGADVVKVEPPGGEASRAWTPRHGGVSGYFATYNTGKRSIVIDLGRAEDRSLLDRLAGSADVLLQNLRTGALARHGFGSAEMLRRHPRMVYCSISGYGANGPADPALDTVIQAGSGVMMLVDHDATPCKVGFSVGDLLAGSLAVAGILAALRCAERTGRGGHVDLSMLHALFWSSVSAWDSEAVSGCCVAATDGWVAAEAVEDRVHSVLGGTLAAGDAVARLAAAGIPAMRVRELGEVFSDPLLGRRRMMREPIGPEGTRVPVLAAPFGLTGTPPVAGRVIGAPDGDRAAILAEWLHGLPHRGTA